MILTHMKMIRVLNPKLLEDKRTFAYGPNPASNASKAAHGPRSRNWHIRSSDWSQYSVERSAWSTIGRRGVTFLSCSLLVARLRRQADDLMRPDPKSQMRKARRCAEKNSWATLTTALTSLSDSAGSSEPALE